ncbi:MAG: helix-turn-helix domain-containing protein [Parvularcula sp.]|jgi:excisionase family DNA binding protein|nr:helix-turn-helix domain-containing protein [Parvularcula sp.]
MQAAEPMLMTKREAAARYRVSLRQVTALIGDGVLPAVRLGRRCVRVPVAKADAVMNSLTTGGRV